MFSIIHFLLINKTVFQLLVAFTSDKKWLFFSKISLFGNLSFFSYLFFNRKKVFVSTDVKNWQKTDKKNRPQSSAATFINGCFPLQSIIFISTKKLCQMDHFSKLLLK